MIEYTLNDSQVKKLGLTPEKGTRFYLHMPDNPENPASVIQQNGQAGVRLCKEITVSEAFKL